MVVALACPVKEARVVTEVLLQRKDSFKAALPVVFFLVLEDDLELSTSKLLYALHSLDAFGSWVEGFFHCVEILWLLLDLSEVSEYLGVLEGREGEVTSSLRLRLELSLREEIPHLRGIKPN